MLEIRYLNSFKKDYKLAKKRGKNISKLKTVIEIIAEGKNFQKNTRIISSKAVNTKAAGNVILSQTGFLYTG